MDAVCHGRNLLCTTTVVSADQVLPKDRFNLNWIRQFHHFVYGLDQSKKKFQIDSDCFLSILMKMQNRSITVLLFRFYMLLMFLILTMLFTVLYLNHNRSLLS